MALLFYYYSPCHLSDNVQHDLQHGSLITFPKEENLGNKKKPMHQVYLPSVPTFPTINSVCVGSSTWARAAIRAYR